MNNAYHFYCPRLILFPFISVMDVQQSLLNKENANSEITEEFIETFAALINSRWPLLASLLSFTTSEIEHIKREVTGMPPVKAAAMLGKWKERTIGTYGVLMIKVAN